MCDMSQVSHEKAEKREGCFSATKTKFAQNCWKWIDPVKKNFPSSWGGGFSATKNQSCLKLPEMNRSSVKKFSFILGGGAFLPSNHQCEVQWCMKYRCVKLCHITWFELSISPKGRKEGGFLADLLALSFCQLNTVVFRFIRKNNNLCISCKGLFCGYTCCWHKASSVYSTGAGIFQAQQPSFYL